MAAASYITGELVTIKRSGWDSFVDQKGETVQAGERFSAWIYTPHDDDLCEVRYDKKRQTAEEAMALFAGTKHGDMLTITTGAQSSYGHYNGVFGVKPSGNAKAA